MITIYITESIFSNSSDSFNVANSKNLGEIKDKKVYFSPFEALFLVESKKAEAIRNKPLTESQLISFFQKKDKDFFIKYLVFKELRKKGYIVKTGSKFGADFRVYEKSMNHAKYIVYPVKQSEKINWNEFISKNRISHSTAKKLLLAIIDSENNVLFYETDWVKI